MRSLNQIYKRLNDANTDKVFERLYGKDTIQYQKQRYLQLIQIFKTKFPNQSNASFFSTPGRTEIGGNHTDHNGGRVLAAAVSLDIVALVAPNTDNNIRIYSEGYEVIEIKLSELNPIESEKFTSTALVRGVCACLQQLGYIIGGFDAVISGEVPKGAGLSSSAAFEVLIVYILNQIYNYNTIDAIEIAQIAQFAENHYFGKPCGLMDQTTCAVGGIITIDFENFNAPKVNKVAVDFSKSGYLLVIVDTGGNHADLNEDYIALEHEMKSVAKAFNKDVLRQINAEMVYSKLKNLRIKCGDRAILRALHFFGDDQRVVDQVTALEKSDFKEFFELIIDSGESSWMLCQNCYSSKYPHEQGISMALELVKFILKDKGAYRVHGGGFAGTIQAFIPNDFVKEFDENVSKVFGKGSCHVIQIRNEGCIEVII